MQIRSPELTSEQIAKWMRYAAARPAVNQATSRAQIDLNSSRHHPGFDFKKAKQALNRARAKTDVNTIKPLRRLRRNQGAVNEALIDAFSALVAVNKQMASEITALSGEMATLRQGLAQSEAPGNSTAENIFG
jgi:hypothetical protein